MTDAPEDAAIRLKRLRMRSWRRGTKEMDLILGRFADARLATLSAVELDAYEALLVEDDPALYDWFSGRLEPPSAHHAMLAQIRRLHGGELGKGSVATLT